MSVTPPIRERISQAAQAVFVRDGIAGSRCSGAVRVRRSSLDGDHDPGRVFRLKSFIQGWWRAGTN